MQAFEYQLRPKIVFGQGQISRLGDLARECISSDRESPIALLVSDPGVVAAGIFDRGRASLEAAGFKVVGFHDFGENPDTHSVEQGVAVSKEHQPDLLVGLGGGSSMDCAKGINFVYSCGGQMKDYWGVGKATGPLLPFIAIPTTSGTGSETQSFALISDAESHVKMACGDPRASCKVAILDPELTYTQPTMVTALTGIDAITHALESYVCNKRNAMSECYSLHAWNLLATGFPSVLEKPDDVQARERMQLGASFAGMAIESSMLGIAHSLANPLTAHLGTAHGQAVGMMMPHVIRFNAVAVPSLYEALWNSIAWQLPPSPEALASCSEALATALPSPQTASSNPHSLQTAPLQTAAPHEKLACLFTSWLTKAGLQSKLKDLPGWPTDAEREETLLKELAEGAAKQWTATFNPRPVTADDLLVIYRSAL